MKVNITTAQGLYEDERFSSTGAKVQQKNGNTKSLPRFLRPQYIRHNKRQ